MNRSPATANNEQASEHDMVITTANGMQAQAASQFAYYGADGKPAPPGMVYFQTSDSNGHWQNAALVPIPKPGEDTSVSMEVKLVGNNQYEYSGLTINGKTYALNPAESTFNMHYEAPDQWSRNTVITQLQEDTRANGGPISQVYSNVSIETGYTPPT
jgi:hypothetical protein